MDNRQLFLQNLAQTSDSPLALEFTYAEGSFLFDKHQKPYLDLISGISVSNVGHRHPKVVAAIKNQVDSYLHQMVYGEYIQSPQVKLASALVDSFSKLNTLSGAKIDNVYFTNSGTEAVEGALKLAKRYTGKTEIIAIKNSYHGSTHGALSLGEEQFKRGFRPLLPGIKKIERNNLNDIIKVNKNTAAVIIEPIGAESGILETNLDFIQKLAQRCQEHGTLLIFDEIQTGFGRTGKFWAAEHFGFLPDIMLSAKGMGGGMPIGAFMAPQHIMAVFKENPILGHITTFGGHPVSCAASLATLEIIRDEIDLVSIEVKGKQIKKIFEKHPLVKSVRGKGLMLAAQFENFEILKTTIDGFIEKGLITDWFLYCDNAMRISPPLNISEEEIAFVESVVLG
ncbi:aspartate aminotransferase family protein [Lacihabitans sp. LS3-19]|uniref:aspartate aminotransferase family protein n=1 Tax=Lacihabitans sp. LS3-19 TaxID=2487335 RepID=UPI0020CEFF2D|nr:aminotransferase class III-fold pyridoxal phosphate-dependent enzyme [Lacihabitans sp. LS3-19]MCP9769798.1 aspartate aminotransferase family protein [Lacihabitans sp. LS3-19]